MKVKARDYEAPALIQMAIECSERSTTPGWKPTTLFFGVNGVFTNSMCPEHSPEEVAEQAQADCLRPRSGPWAP